MKEINWEEFQQVELRVWTIIEAINFPEARKPAYKIRVDFWEEIWIKKSSAQITDIYTKEELIGKQIIWVINFPSKQVWPFISECLITWFIQDNWKVVLAVPDNNVKNGLKLA